MLLVPDSKMALLMPGASLDCSATLHDGDPNARCSSLSLGVGVLRKTTDQYYSGENNTIQRGAVRSILDAVVTELNLHSDRTFTWTEQVSHAAVASPRASLA